MKIVNIPEYNVSQFNQEFKKVIESNFDYIRIKGEVSEVKIATKGQIYITLKDNESILSCVVWEQKKKYLDFQLETGMEVIVTGKITTWSKYRTTYQLDIDKIELSGEGALLKLIEERKTRLKAKGIFDKETKKPIPFLPQRIGVITSPTGSVIYDIINRIKERCPTAIDLWPTPVQGVSAAQLIIEAIKGFNNMDLNDRPDVLLVARGGGSTEDLMLFNDEDIAIEVFNSSIPIITAIGHETDFTIIDDAADIRASTPTAAAEIVVPVRKELEQNVLSLKQRLNYLIINYIKTNKNYFENLKKFLKAPNLILSTFSEKLDLIYSKLDKEIKNNIEKNYIIFINLKNNIRLPSSDINFKKSRLKVLYNDIDRIITNRKKYSNESLNKLARLMDSNSLVSNLKKGYSILTIDNKIIKDSNLIKKEDEIKARLNKGTLCLNVKKIN